MSIEKPTLHEMQTHEGRIIEESKQSGYCGSCSLSVHINQINDYDYSRQESEWLKIYFLSKVSVTVLLK